MLPTAKGGSDGRNRFKRHHPAHLDRSHKESGERWMMPLGGAQVHPFGEYLALIQAPKIKVRRHT
jgi:hypothetical protein